MAAVLAEAKKRVENVEAKVEAAVSKAVHELADEAVAHSPDSVKKYAGLFEFDSPVVITLVTVCTLIHAVTAFIWSDFTLHFFSCHPFPFTSLAMDPFRTWWRLLSHTLGHSSWQHLSGNASLILLVGPPCEKEYGSRTLLRILSWTAFTTGLCHNTLGPRNAVLMGASGIAFALILLNSLLNVHDRRIPVTFVLTCALWLSSECGGFVMNFLAGAEGGDGVSHLAHLFGALVGATFGFLLHHPEKKKTWWEKLQRRAHFMKRG